MPPVFSAVTAWELRLKWHSLHISGERKGLVNPAAVVAFAERLDWEFLPLTVHHAAAGSPSPSGEQHRNKCLEETFVAAITSCA